METHQDAVPPTPEEARNSLQSAQAEENATLYRPVPGWFYPLLAGLLLLLLSLNALDVSSGGNRVIVSFLILAIAITLGLLSGKVIFHQPGYKGLRVKWKTILPVTLTAVAFPLAAIALEGVLGSWVWIIAGIGIAVLIISLGAAFRRKQAHG